MRSTADDMLRYLQAHLALDAVPLPERTDATALRTALAEVLTPRVGRRRTGVRICLGWNQRSPDDPRSPDDRDSADEEDAAGVADGLVYHAGATRGFTTFVGFSPRAQVGLAVMAGTQPMRGRGFVQGAHETLRTLVAEQRPE
ncbi:serine hydrolase [Streptomyces sp. CB03911]|uniref:serine hydrolase n=1 Tax=Streptomyces sp. CB03911 TaxID=1804758 RepID=UPI000967C307|nr:serine hydrolase [Streptomyces sp. CB03911]OKI24502.1 hypothetical protein A6A07_06535 [Streptomyces sp. CB03911]